ncbi:ribosome hibernation-promoting factor, HPF/YfiA family [Nitrosococcus watsonii]|uniref:Ribosome hibernation promoting factor n=1 Tax=Nitrosococcus watsoni (strain C-113) TaxID=105559 RepID=D8K9H5_NITWC|nr:ribosome-associated translation inhibitor RaiA [Nitrosococcus watsonii]ADJ27264.1 ribosomal subunit interface protein [Nitrosococcus watsonii C-113]
MQVNITGNRIEITQALRNYIENKCERLERHFDQLIHLHIVLSVEKMRQKAEATLHLSGANVFASAEDEDMYAAIDDLTDKLDRQIKKHREKLTDHRRSEGIIKKQQQG